MSHCLDKNVEDLFRSLLRSDGSKFEEDIVKNWYRARKFVLGTLVANDVFDNIIRQQQKIHVVLEGTSDLMLSVARQIAFVAHYPTFNDTTGNNRTIITILFDKTKVSPSSILDIVSKEEYLYNLSRYCKCTIRDFNANEPKSVEKSFLDVELELIGFDGMDFSKYNPIDTLRIKESDITDDVTDDTIDISLAKRVNMVYNVGMDIDNLPPDDPNTAERYDKALFYFCYQQSPKDTQEKWDQMGNSQIDIKNKLSNVFCSDCFPSRLIYIINENKEEKDKIINFLDLEKHVNKKYQKVVSIVKDNIESLARCEHARWNVEKLLLGFRPLSEKEHLEDEQLFGKDRKDYRKALKKRGIHIDLCSYRDLRRINPGDMKYDCFLMIAMPRIILECEKNNSLEKKQDDKY